MSIDPANVAGVWSPTHSATLVLPRVVRDDARDTRTAPADADHAARVEASLAEIDQLLTGLQDPAIDTLVSVVMPVFNERATVEKIIQRVLAVPMPMELIVIDDGSTDGTREVLARLAEQMPIRLLRHKRNRGKGAALKTGLAAARGEIIAIQDADLEYNPAELPALVKPIALGCCDVMYGSRYLAPLVEDPSRLHRLGNRLLTQFSNLMTRQNLSDMETCYKVFRKSAVGNLRLRQNGFGCEPELTAKLSRRGLRIYEMPISYTGRSRAAGKKIRLRDAVNAVWCIVRYGVAD